MLVMLTCQYTEALGGGETQCATLTEELRRQGERVVVLTSRVPGFDIPAKEVDVVRLSTWKSPYLMGRHSLPALFWAAKAFWWIARNRKSISAIDCHLIRINAYVAALAHWFFSIPTIMLPGAGGEMNDFNFIARPKYIFGKRGVRFIIRHSSKVICIASEIEADSLKWGVSREKIQFIPNGVNLERLVKSGPTSVLDRGKTYEDRVEIAFIGRLAPAKNTLKIMEAFLSIPADRRLRLNLIGDGPLEDELKEVFSNYKGKSEVIFHGRQSNVFALLPAMHYFILVSSSEGLSNALLEACAGGLVPILSDASGNRDVVNTPDYPLFIKDQSVEQIAGSISTATAMSQDEWSRWSEKIGGYVRINYDIKSIGRKYTEVYHRVIQQERSAA